MRRLAIMGALSACLLGGIPFEAMADEKALEERIKKLEKIVEDLKKHEAEEAKTKEKKEGEQPLGFGSTGSGKLIYAKPFLSSPRTTVGDRKSTRLNSSHGYISYAVFCLKKKTARQRFQDLVHVRQHEVVLLPVVSVH